LELLEDGPFDLTQAEEFQHQQSHLRLNSLERPLRELHLQLPLNHRLMDLLVRYLVQA
jgi:hypothetical protein